MSLGSLGLGFSAVTQHIGAAVACGGVVITGAIAEMMRQQRQQGPVVAVDTSTPFEENELSEDTGMSPSVESSPLLGGAQDLPSTRAGVASSTKPSVAVAAGGPGLIVDDPSTGPLRAIDHEGSRTVPSIVGDDFDEEISGPGPAVAQQRLGTLVQPADYEITDRTPIVSNHYGYGDSEDTVGHEIVAQDFEATRDRLPWERDRAGEEGAGEPDFLVQGVRSDHVVDAWRGSRQGPHTGSVPVDHAPQTDLNVAAAERAAVARADAADAVGPLPGLDRLRASSALGGPGHRKPSWVANQDLPEASVEDLSHMPAPAPESGPITLPPHLSRPDSPAPGLRVPAVPTGTPRRFLPGGLSKMSVFDHAPATGGHIVEFSDVGQVPASEQSGLVDLDADLTEGDAVNNEASNTLVVTSAENVEADDVAASPTSVCAGEAVTGSSAGQSTEDARHSGESAVELGEPSAQGLDAPVTAANVALASSWQAMRQRIDEAEWAERNAERADNSTSAASSELPSLGEDSMAARSTDSVETDYFGASVEDHDAASEGADQHRAGKYSPGKYSAGSNHLDHSLQTSTAYGQDHSRAMAGGSLETPEVDRSSPFTRVDSVAETTDLPNKRSPFTGSQPVVPATSEQSPILSTRRPSPDAVTLPPDVTSSLASPVLDEESAAITDRGSSASQLTWSSHVPVSQDPADAGPVEPPNARSGQSLAAAGDGVVDPDVVLPNPEPVPGTQGRSAHSTSVFGTVNIDDDTELPRANDTVFSSVQGSFANQASSNDISFTSEPLWESPTESTSHDADEPTGVAPAGAQTSSRYEQQSHAAGPEALASQRRAARRAKTRRRGRGDSVFATQEADDSSSLEISEPDESSTEPRMPRGPAPRTDQVDQSYSKMKERIEALRKSTGNFDD